MTELSKLAMSLRTLLGIAAVSLFFSHGVSAQTTEPYPDMEQIEQYWQKGDFGLVRRGLENLAKDETNTLAHYRYGRVLIEGRGGPVDFASGMQWLEKASSQGNAQATTLLARAILSSKVENGPVRAAKLFTNAAARGDAEAQYYLGLLYQTGRGVAQDDEAAFNWLLAASEGGYAQAKWELSKAYAGGQGTTKAPDKAFKWMEDAANAGQRDAQFYLGQTFSHGRGVARNLQTAQAWYRRAAENGQVLGMRELGTIYLNGTEITPSDGQEAMRWLSAAAEAGDAVAMHNIAIGSITGTVIPRDDALALRWLEIASSQKLGAATFVYGKMHENGRGVPVDLEKAVGLYVLAASQGHKPAALHLGALTASGELDGVVAPHVSASWAVLDLRETQNPKALAWLETQSGAGVRPAQVGLGMWLLSLEGRAAEGALLLETAATAGDVQAQFQVGSNYTTGTGVALDYTAAYKWLNIAAASGHDEAAEMRSLISDLMTPEQVADGQTATRLYFESALDRAPQTQQTVVKSGEGN